MPDADDAQAGRDLSLMTQGEVAALLRRTTRTIRNLTASGDLPVVKFGGRPLYLRSDVEKLIYSRR